MVDLSSEKGAHVADRLRTDQIVWLGTVRADGRPHLVPVWFLWDGEAVLIFSKTDQKVRNLRNNPNVVLALDDTKGGGDVGLVEGTAELPTESTADVAPAAYFEKYAAAIAQFGWNREGMAAEYHQPIRVRPSRLISW